MAGLLTHQLRDSQDCFTQVNIHHNYCERESCRRAASVWALSSLGVMQQVPGSCHQEAFPHGMVARCFCASQGGWREKFWITRKGALRAQSISCSAGVPVTHTLFTRTSAKAGQLGIIPGSPHTARGKLSRTCVLHAHDILRHRHWLLHSASWRCAVLGASALVRHFFLAFHVLARSCSHGAGRSMSRAAAFRLAAF